MTEQNMDSSGLPSQFVHKIVEGIFQIKMPLMAGELSDLNHVNIYLVQGSHGWTLIDTGWKTEKTVDFLNQALAAVPVKISDIERIIISHTHPDHYGLAGEFKKILPQVPIFIHYWEKLLIQTRYIDYIRGLKEADEYLEKHGFPKNISGNSAVAFRNVLEKVVPVLPDSYLTGGEIISTGVFDLEIIWTPGHSPGHICIYEPRNQILFAGDYILPSITPNISSSPVSGDDPLGAYLDCYNKIKQLAVKLVLPGHQDPFSDWHKRMRTIVLHHKDRGAEILESMSDNPLNAYQIASLITWTMNKKKWTEIPPVQQRMATGEVIAHMEHLYWQGKVKRIWQSSQIQYQKKSIGAKSN